MKSRQYKVAGHFFEVRMDAGAELWQLMEEPYGPFSAMGDDLLFRVTLSPETIAPEGMSLVYSNHGSAQLGQIELAVWKCDDGHYFEFTQPGSPETNGQLYVTDDFKEATLYLDGPSVLKWLTFNTAVNFCYLLAAACHKTVLMHASCVRYKERAYLFLGKSGTGKSTHSRMWLNALDGVELMNDDHPVVRIGADGSPIAYGSPWSGKTRCYKNIEAPVGGVIRISRAPYNKARRLSAIESYASVITSCSGMVWEKELADGRDETIQSLIKAVPCWVMECLPDEDAARVCSRAVENV